MALAISVLETEIAFNILPYLRLPSLLSIYCLLSKHCLEECTRYLMIHKDIHDGVLNRANETIVLFIIDAAISTVFKRNLCACSTDAAKVITASGILGIRQNNRFAIDLFKLHAAMFTFWESTSRTPYRGIFHNIYDFGTHTDLPITDILLSDCRFWYRCRICGYFYVLFERADGTILVSEDCKRVYLVLGFCRSVAYACNLQYVNHNFVARPPYPSPLLHGPLIGLKVRTTLLSLEDKIIYDTILHPIEFATEKTLKKVLQTYVKAVDNYNSSNPEGTSPQFITKLNKDLSQATKLEPEEIHPQELQLQAFRQKFRYQLDYMAAKPSAIRGFQAKKQKFADNLPKLLFRRHGYTEEDNPTHLLYVIHPEGGPESLLTTETLQSLIPTLEEYIDILEFMVQSNFLKPCVVFIDAIEHYPVLSALLEEYCNISVIFYPPHSPEQQFIMNEPINPKTIKACEICHSKLAEDGTKLLACSRCKNAYYCCAAHQKEDWKRHKVSCSPTNL